MRLDRPKGHRESERRHQPPSYRRLVLELLSVYLVFGILYGATYLSAIVDQSPTANLAAFV